MEDTDNFIGNCHYRRFTEEKSRDPATWWRERGLRPEETFIKKKKKNLNFKRSSKEKKKKKKRRICKVRWTLLLGGRGRWINEFRAGLIHIKF